MHLLLTVAKGALTICEFDVLYTALLTTANECANK